MKNLKRILIAAAAALLLLSLSACGAKQDDKTIRVGASPAPHAQILKAAEPLLKEKGYTLVIQEFSDYVLPNNALEEGSLDANFFQHEPYLLDFNQENGTHLVAVANIHYEPMGVYAGKSASLDSIPSGAQIAVPSDTTNEARALQLLEKIGLIKLKEGAGLTATKNDIADNPHQIRIVETEAAQVPRTLQDVDFAVANGNYAISAGVTDKVLVKEDSSTKYGNIVAVKEGQESSAKTTALVEALTSDTVRQFIVDEFGETAVPMV